MERSSGILIRLTRLTDTSLIVHWFTADFGLIKTVAKGARRPKSPFNGKLDLFFSSDIHWSPARRSELHALREAEPTHCRERLRREYRSLLLASYFARLLEMAVEGEHPEPELHDLLRRALDHVDEAGASRRAFDHFESELARLLGLGSDRQRASSLLQDHLGNLPGQRQQFLDSL
jgi:DNA repair protein RecO (recombination protein O)